MIFNLLPFLDIMINNIGAKIWMCIYNKPRDSKLYDPFTSSYPGHCLTNIQSSLIWRRICTIAENANVKKKKKNAKKKKNIEKGTEKKHY